MAGSAVACYFDDEGHVAIIVHSDEPNYDLSRHDQSWPNHARVNVPRDVYESLPAPINVDGVAHHHHIAKWHLDNPQGWSEFEARHPHKAKAIRERVKATEAWLAARP